MMNFSHLFPGNKNQGKICITTYYDDKFGVIGDLCYKSIVVYAEKHGLEAVLLRGMETSRPLPWHKILVIQRLFAAGYDYVFWIDADAIFVSYDSDISLEIEKGKDLYLVKHAIDAKDVPNTGVMLIKNSGWSSLLLNMIWLKEQYLNHKWWENAAVLDILGYHNVLDENRPNRINPNLMSKIKWLGVEWNTVPGVCEAKQPIIHHYAGMPLEHRTTSIIKDFNLYSGGFGQQTQFKR